MAEAPSLRPGRAGPLRLRSSVLLKVVLALVVALIVSSTFTSVVAAHLTRRVLDHKARELGKGQLAILHEAYAERDRTLSVNLRNQVQIFNARGLFAPEQRAELIAEIGRVSANLDLGLLRVLDEWGNELAPRVGVGDELANPHQLPRVQPGNVPDSQVYLSKQGTFVQATLAATFWGDHLWFLVGGYPFSDAFAYDLRQQIGSVDDVLLVADGRVVGSTLPDPPQRPPALASGQLPVTPSPVRFNGIERNVAYVPVGRAQAGAVSSIGLVLADSVSTLDESLARTRLLATLLLTLVTVLVAWLLFRFLIRPLVRLAQTAGRITTGDLDARFEAETHDEIGTLAAILEAMRSELRCKLQLVATQANELRESSQRIVAAEDRERHRLARDLHDGIQQQLVVLRMQMALGEEGGVDRVEQFERVGQELDAIISQLREVTQNLYPSILLDRGLVPATRSRIGRLPLYTRFVCSPEAFPRLAVEIESAAYFLICEALTNALKHSSATEITVSLSLDDRWLVVTVEDNGVGFAAEQVRASGGLVHMQDRVRPFEGTFEIQTPAGGGTRVVATFPKWLADEQPGPAAAVSPRSSGGRTGPPRPFG